MLEESEQAFESKYGQTRRRYLAAIAGVGVGAVAAGSGAASAESSDTIQLNVRGSASTGSPPVVTATFGIDLSELDADTFDETENLQFEIRNETTDETLLVDPDEPIVDTLKGEFGLRNVNFDGFEFIEPTGEIAAEPAISIGLDEVPVSVSGDTTLFRNESIVNTYEAAILDDGEVLFETPTQQIATQYPDGFVQTAAGDTLEYECRKRDLAGLAPRLEIGEVLEDGTPNEIVGSVASEDTDFVGTVETAAFTADADVEFRSPDMQLYADEAGAEDGDLESQVFETSGPGVVQDQDELDGALEAEVDDVDTDASVGDPITVEYTVTNIGETDSGEFRSVELYTLPETGAIPDEAQASTDLDILAPDDTTSGSFEYTPSDTDTGRLTLLVSPGRSGERKVGVETVTVENGDGETPAVDTTLTLTNVGSSAWEVTDIEGEDATAPLGVENPTIELEPGARYAITNEGWDAHPLALRDADGTPLLTQDGEGDFEADDAVAWVDDGSSIEFTLTEELADQLATYICTVHSAMEGTIDTDPGVPDDVPEEISEYTDADGDVTIGGLRDAISDFSAGDADIDTLRAVIDAFAG